jgi:hypothetical protein
MAVGELEQEISEAMMLSSDHLAYNSIQEGIQEGSASRTWMPADGKPRAAVTPSGHI